ncbi:hypothetical protein PGT21_015330 [Puccinia graminis f. sp. tritici]|uniref:Uncharacterized protein n=1 Tax=Puccinia graminis f. sp. tritici TaxID=56615 RepID=A0A5B0MDH3_PUCGR|nr:hypothetical protein PGT21_015330 [Puccinia graminis f. sp. tritici]KAA1115905.1 hypothetical protein PGTUg99_018860 [Puccinia graminis f. sp. tritici]
MMIPEQMETKEMTRPMLAKSEKDDISISLRPPPWYLEGEGWWIILSILGPVRKRIVERIKQESRKKKTKPSADSTHSDSLGLLSPAPTPDFRGGFGSVQIIRYHSSPVGAYDELLLIPGVFKPPEESLNRTPVFRITQIYVSTLGSVLNGRHHWNIPKKLARFEFTPVEGTTNKLNVKIYGLKSFRFTRSSGSTGWYFDPEFFDAPFFNMTIHRHLAPLNIPVDLGKLPILDLTLLQPPLQTVDDDDHQPLEPDLLHLNPPIVDHSEWKRTELGIKGRCGLCSFKGNLQPGNRKAPQFADGEHFPDIKPYRIGFHFPRISLKVLPASSILASSDPLSEKH